MLRYGYRTATLRLALLARVRVVATISTQRPAEQNIILDKLSGQLGRNYKSRN